MARRANNSRDYEGEVRKRNELRRDAQLPLLDVEAEAARLQWLDRDTAYENFFKVGAEVVAHARYTLPDGRSGRHP